MKTRTIKKYKATKESKIVLGNAEQLNDGVFAKMCDRANRIYALRKDEIEADATRNEAMKVEAEILERRT